MSLLAVPRNLFSFGLLRDCGAQPAMTWVVVAGGGLRWQGVACGGRGSDGGLGGCGDGERPVVVAERDLW